MKDIFFKDQNLSRMTREILYDTQFRFLSALGSNQIYQELNAIAHCRKSDTNYCTNYNRELREEFISKITNFPEIIYYLLLKINEYDISKLLLSNFDNTAPFLDTLLNDHELCKKILTKTIYAGYLLYTISSHNPINPLEVAMERSPEVMIDVFNNSHMKIDIFQNIDNHEYKGIHQKINNTFIKLLENYPEYVCQHLHPIKLMYLVTINKYNNAFLDYAKHNQEIANKLLFSAVETHEYNILINLLLLEDSEFLVNAKNIEGDTIVTKIRAIDTYNIMKNDFFFILGYIPRGDELVDNNLKSISYFNNSQSVHDATINNKYAVAQLVSHVPNNHDLMLTLQDAYNDISRLYIENSEYLAAYLRLSDTQKKFIFQDTYAEKYKFTSDDTEAAKNILSDASCLLNILITQQEYSEFSFEYDEEQSLSIHELTAKIYLYLYNLQPTSEQTSAVCADIIYYSLNNGTHEQIIRSFLPQLDEILSYQNIIEQTSSLTEHDKDLLCSELVYGRSMQKIFYEQNIMTLAIQLYIAANTYPGTSSVACTSGICTQIIQTLLSVNPDEFMHSGNTQNLINEQTIIELAEPIKQALTKFQTPKTIEYLLAVVRSDYIDKPETMSYIHQSIVGIYNQYFINYFSTTCTTKKIYDNIFTKVMNVTYYKALEQIGEILNTEEDSYA